MTERFQAIACSREAAGRSLEHAPTPLVSAALKRLSPLIFILLSLEKRNAICAKYVWVEIGVPPLAHQRLVLWIHPHSCSDNRLAEVMGEPEHVPLCWQKIATLQRIDSVFTCLRG